MVTFQIIDENDGRLHEVGLLDYPQCRAVVRALELLCLQWRFTDAKTGEVVTNA